MAEWVVEGEPEWDLWSLDPRRYTGYVTKSFTAAQAIELYQNEYAIGFPTQERPGRPPGQDLLGLWPDRGKGAVFGARGGWERAVWFPRSGDDVKEPASFHRGTWFERVGEECRAVQNAAGLLDLPGITRFEVAGRDAAGWLDGMIATRLPRAGRCGLGYFLSTKGGVLAEVTIAALAPDRFWILSGAGAAWHDRDWLERHLPQDGWVRLGNLTPAYDTLVLAGPKSRDILARVTDADLSTAAFPWMALREIDIGFAPAAAMRITEIGELGYELHLPMEYAAGVYEALMAAGDALGLPDFGVYAMDSLRMEKGYRGWKCDMMREYTPAMAGLDRFVRSTRATSPAATAVTGANGHIPRLVSVLLLVENGDADAPPFAIVLAGGTQVGFVTSGLWPPHRPLAVAGLRRPALAVFGTRLDVDIFGERRLATVCTVRLRSRQQPDEDLTDMADLPTHARVVIIGGGVVGLLGRLSSGQARLDRRGAAGAQAAHLRHDLACGGPDRPARARRRT